MSWQDQLNGIRSPGCWSRIRPVSATWRFNSSPVASRMIPSCLPPARWLTPGSHCRGSFSHAPAGYWVEPGPGYLPKYRSTIWSIQLLAQLGASVEQDPRIAQACAYILDHALAPGGQFTASGAPSGTGDCLQGEFIGSLMRSVAPIRAWILLMNGWRAPSPAKVLHRTPTATPPCATTPANVVRSRLWLER